MLTISNITSHVCTLTFFSIEMFPHFVIYTSYVLLYKVVQPLTKENSLAIFNYVCLCKEDYHNAN